MRQHPSADLGEHPHRVLGRHLGDVDDLVAVEQGHVRRLTGLLDQAGEIRPGPGAQQSGRGLAEADQARAEGVAAVGLLAYVSAGHERAHQAVDGGQRQPAARGQLAQTDLAARVGHPFEQVEGALKGLDATVGGPGGVGGAGAGRRHGAFLSGPVGGPKPTRRSVDSPLVRSYVLLGGSIIPLCGNVQSVSGGCTVEKCALDGSGTGVKTPSTES